MRFPGQRIAKHYFPVSGEPPRAVPGGGGPESGWCLVGLDQVLVDVEVHTPQNFVEELGLSPGESVRLDDDDYQALVDRIEREGFTCRYAAGGSVANTLNNYTYLAQEPAVLLGAIPRLMQAGDAAFHYVAQTPRTMDLSHLKPVNGPMGTAITFVQPDGERSFAVAPGVSNAYGADDVPVDLVQRATAVLTTLYTLADEEWPICGATMRLLELAAAADVPVALGLGTASLARAMRREVQQLLQRYVTIAAMNQREAAALTGESDPMLACRKTLEWVDLVIVTQGPEGMTIGGYTDESCRRHTRQPVRSKSIDAYNRWEYSRLVRRDDCQRPCQIFTHIHPYRGGPSRLANCSGAGDAALAAVLHDVAANRYHRATVPDSDKHRAGVRFLSYSSLSRNAQYGNRVAYEVLRGDSPRLAGPVGADQPIRTNGDGEGGD